MHKILAILALTVAMIVPSYGAEGRRTAAALGFVAGAATGWIVRDAMGDKPCHRETVVYREAPVAPVREVVIVREAPAPPPVQVIVIEGRTYTVPANGGTVIIYTNGNNGWTPPPVVRMAGIEN